MMTGNRIMLLDTSELADKDLFAGFYKKMSTERKNKIDALKVESAKRLSLGAGILLEKALAEAGIVVAGAASGAEAPYRIAFGPQGKPYIEGSQDFFFNLSHSGSMVAIAVSDREVGVDIQKLRHFDERLSNYVFNIEDREFAKELLARYDIASVQDRDGASDMASVQDRDGASNMDYIYTRMWAMKESVMKHNGKGLAMEPQKIVLRLDDGAAARGNGVSEAKNSSGGQFFSKIRVSHPGYDCEKLFIHDYSCSGVDGSFYGIAVCSEYEEFCPPDFCSLNLG
ncbi:4'-phosphopantetheinyl transferase superfamily protein [Butyrivibrio sp. CB08]|uniref:4'-phosphopantetheinyl transferase family protein n=1 Tax=Butyrivibrio sp. CB08 TaxID=2364879 RepID=UPI000EA89E93|nr:4'-phosphopantetheinyl transferase superfamily protein [Butyrivibrio sp. CB08]RKM60431.1 4'-phosphopantetheinyl transferase superfamily protein [Butyrivibrio sp. CB08]